VGRAGREGSCCCGSWDRLTGCCGSWDRLTACCGSWDRLTGCCRLDTRLAARLLTDTGTCHISCIRFGCFFPFLLRQFRCFRSGSDWILIQLGHWRAKMTYKKREKRVYISVPRAYEYLIGIISIFFENSWRYSRMNVCQRCQRHRRKKIKI
jgi:hypothetical protein